MASDFLFARPNLWAGLASTVDLWGRCAHRYNQSPTAQLADVRALLSDWSAVRHDLKCALVSAAAENEDVLHLLQLVAAGGLEPGKEHASDVEESELITG